MCMEEPFIQNINNSESFLIFKLIPFSLTLQNAYFHSTHFTNKGISETFFDVLTHLTYYIYVHILKVCLDFTKCKINVHFTV